MYKSYTFNIPVSKRDEEFINRLEMDMPCVSLKKSHVRVNGRTCLFVELEIASGTRLPAWFEPPKVESVKDTYSAKLVAPKHEMTLLEKEIYFRLKTWRHEKAKHLGLPSYGILKDGDLYNIAVLKPLVAGELAQIKGIGKSTMENHAGDIIAITSQYEEAIMDERSHDGKKDEGAAGRSSKPGLVEDALKAMAEKERKDKAETKNDEADAAKKNGECGAEKNGPEENGDDEIPF